jgi:hypothetical protein
MIFEPGKKLFLDVASTNINALDPSLYQCVETCSTNVFLLLSQPLQDLVFHHLQLSKARERISRLSREPL